MPRIMQTPPTISDTLQPNFLTNTDDTGPAAYTKKAHMYCILIDGGTHKGVRYVLYLQEQINQ